MVKAIGGLAFCLLLGAMIWVQGIAALLWTPLGYAFGLFSTSQMFLPLILGLPRAIRLVRKRQMRIGVFGRILVTPLIWFVLLFVVGVLGFLWPSIANFLSDNLALNLGMWLGIIIIILSPLSAECRRDFNEDFDTAYRQFYRQDQTEIPSASDQDYTQAAVWFRKAAEQGDAEAQFAFGYLYDAGQGVPQDYAQAVYWYRKAAEQGCALAQGKLGLMYAKGQGVPRDYAEAYFWLDLAAAGELHPPLTEFAPKYRDEAASHLTPADLSRVQERARKWFEAHQAKPR